MNINTALFDMDGLLLDTEPLWGESMLRIAQKHHIPITQGLFKETTGLRICEVTDYWAVKYPWKGAPAAVVADEIVEDIIALAKKKGRVMPGVQASLVMLKEQGFKIGLASSSPTQMIRALVDFFQLTSYFDCVTSADEVALGKPHPAVFMKCAEQLNSHSMECVVLEDSVNGVIAGKAARMKVIAIPDAAHYNKPQFTLADAKLKSMEELTLSLIHQL